MIRTSNDFEKLKRGYGSVNIWSEIFRNVLIRLYWKVTDDVYVRNILVEQVQPFLRNQAGGMLMHYAREAQECSHRACFAVFAIVDGVLIYI